MISTNLENLARIGQLEKVAFSAEVVQRMLASAQQRLRDAAFTQNSHAGRLAEATALGIVGFHADSLRFEHKGRKANFHRPHSGKEARK